MNAPRENDPNELDRFKRDIDLVDYAERQGYQIKKEGKRGDWHQLEKDGEVLIVTRKDDHQVYLNTGDDRDKGSVIDFAKTRGGDGHGLNLGQVRQQLREYLNDGPAPTRAYAPAADVTRLNALSVGNPDHERQAEEDRRTRLISEVLGVKRELTDRTYLHGRGIEDQTIDSPAFQGRIFTAQQNEHKNTAFPLYNAEGLASVEQKNEHYKNLLPLPKNGIWVSHPTEGKGTQVERIIVSESAIDSLSHHQLKSGQDQKNTIYIATSGTPTEAQVALIQRVIDKQEPREVVLANDRDAGGGSST
ncbi:toprim domain-containing protein [Hymenobacter sp. J193]|uniref:toprim domain-containing protein n=1 Tax=Hymenobacter sp. J193 TaxID=2898429 RepID=UPI002150778A|nr:toprim domain-containing protein [Hymenobacter sp. J193]MCR5890700.1 toprim domain-containing protein [Hymenobacter sp. J193]